MNPLAGLNELHFENIPTFAWFLIIGLLVYWLVFKRKK